MPVAPIAGVFRSRPTHERRIASAIQRSFASGVWEIPARLSGEPLMMYIHARQSVRTQYVRPQARGQGSRGPLRVIDDCEQLSLIAAMARSSK